MGGNIHLKTNGGLNCLYIAATIGDICLCKPFVNKHKFDKHMVDDYKCIALHYSAETGNYELFKFFADIGSDIYLNSGRGSDCLHFVALT